jgi:hypothetical protein
MQQQSDIQHIKPLAHLWRRVAERVGMHDAYAAVLTDQNLETVHIVALRTDATIL